MTQELAAETGSGRGWRPDAMRLVVPPVALAVAVIAAVTDPAGWARPAILAVAVAAFAAWRRWRLPTLALAAGVLAPVVAVQLTGRLEPSLFLVALAGVVAVRWESSPWRRGVTCAALTASPVLIVALQPAGNRIAWGMWVIGIAFSVLLGWVMNVQDRLGRELAAARRQLAVQAQAEERRRVARDVHDLVGHGLAAVLLQVAGARHVLRRDAGAADEALATAEAVGQRSMRELRDTVALLRGHGDGAPAGPLPNITELGELVAAARRGGLQADCRVSGNLASLPPAVGVALYRIAQEALHNATRHAPRASTLVAVTVAGGIAELDISSVGVLGGRAAVPEGPAEVSGSRYGLAGMGERAAIVGGELQAGPTPQGWRVVARVPVPSA